MRISFNPDGYTVWDENFPIILTDAPYERLKSNPEYAIEFVDLLYNEMAEAQKENKTLENSIQKAVEMQEYYLIESARLNDELESLRNEITVTKYTKGRPSIVDWNGERWIYDPQTTFKGGAPGGKSKATQPHGKSETI